MRLVCLRQGHHFHEDVVPDSILHALANGAVLHVLFKEYLFDVLDVGLQVYVYQVQWVLILVLWCVFIFEDLFKLLFELCPKVRDLLLGTLQRLVLDFLLRGAARPLRVTSHRAAHDCSCETPHQPGAPVVPRVKRFRALRVLIRVSRSLAIVVPAQGRLFRLWIAGPAEEPQDGAADLIQPLLDRVLYRCLLLVVGRGPGLCSARRALLLLEHWRREYRTDLRL